MYKVKMPNKTIKSGHDAILHNLTKIWNKKSRRTTPK